MSSNIFKKPFKMIAVKTWCCWDVTRYRTFWQPCQPRLTGKPALCISLALKADAHRPYVLTSGLEQKSAKHATVYQRVKSIDEILGLKKHGKMDSKTVLSLLSEASRVVHAGNTLLDRCRSFREGVDYRPGCGKPLRGGRLCASLLLIRQTQDQIGVYPNLIKWIPSKHSGNGITGTRTPEHGVTIKVNWVMPGFGNLGQLLYRCHLLGLHLLKETAVTRRCLHIEYDWCDIY